MSDGRLRTPRPADLAAQQAVRRIVIPAVAKAYGHRPTDDWAGVCDRCEGDGCYWCSWTGEQK